MKYDLIISGVGGQGIVSIAAVLARMALMEGLNVKQSEIHGMAQRGGLVYSHLRISDKPIRSEVIPVGGAGMILSVEPMEALRYLPWLHPEGWLVSNEVSFENISNYPAVDQLLLEIRKLPRHFLFNADEVARVNGAPRSMNMAMLGAASAHMQIAPEAFERAILAHFGRKGDRVVEQNLKVFLAAREMAESKVAG